MLKRKLSTIILVATITNMAATPISVFAETLNDRVIEATESNVEQGVEKAIITKFSLASSELLASYNEVFKMDNSNIKSITNNGGKYANSTIDKAVDGNFQTHWETGNANSATFTNEVVVELEEVTTLNRIVYGARRDAGGKGFAKEVEIYTSIGEDNNEFELVAEGTYGGSNLDIVEIKFAPTEFKKIKFVFKNAAQGWASASEFMFYKEDVVSDKMSRLFTDETLSVVSEEFNSIEKINALDEEVKTHPLYENFKENIENAKLIIESKEVNYTDATVSNFKDFNSEELVKYNELFKLSKDKVTSITTNGGHYGSSNIEKAIDGDVNTSWHSGKTNNDSFTNEVIITLDEISTLDRIVYTAARGTNRGFAEVFDIYASTTSKGDTFELVSSGTASKTQNSIEIKFNPTEFKRVKFVFKQGYENWALAAEFGLYTVDELRDKVARLFTDSTMNTVSEEFSTLEKINELEEEAKAHPFYNDFKEDIANARELIEIRNINYTDAKVSKFMDINSELLPAYDEAYKLSSDKITSITANGGHYGSSNIQKAIDGDVNTSWHSGRQNTADFTNEVIMTLDQVTTLNRIVYTAARGTNRGFAEIFDIYASTTSKGDTFELVSSGTSNVTQDSIEIKFNPTEFKRVKFVFKKGYENWALAAEFGLYTQDETSEKIEKLFVNGLMTEVSEEFNTIDKINALEIEINGHPLKELFKEYISIAKDILEGQLVTTKVVIAEQHGNMSEHANKNLKFGFGNNNQPTGVSAMPGETIVVYVDADPNQPLPRLMFSQQEGSFANWGAGVSLHPGKNVITVPEVSKDNWYKHDVTKGGPIYIVNPYTKEQQPKTPVIRFVGGEQFPFLTSDTNEEEFKEFLIDYKARIDEDIANNPDVLDREVIDTFEFVSDHLVWTGTATGAYEAYINQGVSPLATVKSYNRYMDELFKYYGLDGSNEKNDPKYIRENVRLAQPFGYMYAATGHIGVQRDVMSSLLKPFEESGSSWGLTHEIGHKMDVNPRLYGETTNNMLPIYMDTTVYGVSPANDVPYEGFTYKNTISDNRKSYANQDYFQKLGVFWQLELQNPGYWAKLNQFYREREVNLGNVDPENVKMQYLVKFSSEVLGEDLSEHFERHGFTVNEETKEETSKYPKTNNKIWYLNNKRVNYKGEGFTTDVDLKITLGRGEDGTKLIFKVDDAVSADLLGYEIFKDGKLIGFTGNDSFIDTNADLDVNSTYTVIPYDLNLKTGESNSIKLLTPTLSVEENVTLAIGSEFDAYKYVTALNYKGEAIENITVKGNVDTDKKGNYEVTYSIIDRDITVEKTMKVNIVSKITYASDIEAISAKVGWGVFRKDKAPNNTPIELDRQGIVARYAKGLGAHADSEVIYNVEEYDRFEAYVGIDQSMKGNNSSAKFEVYVDGEKVYDSGEYTVSRDHEFISIDLTGASELKLITDDLGNSSADQTVWADAKFINDNTKPIIVASDKTVKLGENVDFLDGVTATDIEDGDITSNVVISAENFITNKTGEYTLTYTVTDSDGNVATKERKIIVYSSESYASDNNYTINRSGWGGIRNDKSPNNDRISVLVNGEEKEFNKGIGAHANSELVFDIEAKGYEYFYSVLGLDDNVRNNVNGSVVYKILVDDELVYESSLFRQTTEAEEVMIPVAGASKVTLITNEGPDNDWGDQSVWADAKFLITNSKPRLEVIDKTIKLGEELNVMEGISATDAEDGVLTESIEIVSNSFEEGKLGRFEVVYRITDSDNNVIEEKAYVTVYEEFNVTKSKYGDFDNLETYNEMFKIPVASISNNGGNYSGSPIGNSIDSNVNSHWETGRPNSSSFKNEVIFDLGETSEIDKIAYKSRNGGKGFATSFEIYVSSEAEGNDFILAGQGSYSGSRNDVIEIDIAKTEARRVKFKFVEAYDSWASIGEISFYRNDELAEKIANELFADESKTTVTESYSTLEKLEALRNEVSNHPAASLFKEDLNKAEEVIRASFPVLSIPKSESTKLGVSINLEGGYTATDKEDGDITSSVEVSGEVNFNKAGEYTLTYRVVDSNGNEIIDERTIAVVDMKDYSYLTEYDWKSTSNSYTAPKKDVSTSGRVLRLTGKDGQEVSYERGIGAHSTSTIVYDLSDKNYDYFTSYVGVDRQMYNTVGSVTFEVYVDGEKKFDSGLMNSTAVQKFVEVDINGAKELKLVVTDGGNGNGSDHATWGDAKLHYANDNGIEVNRAELDVLLENISKLDSTNYLEESFENLQVILEEVKVELANGYTQEEIDNLFVKLNQAFEGLIKRTDYSELEEVITNNSEYNELHYFRDVMEAHKVVIEEAKGILANLEATQEEIDAMISKIEESAKTLVTRQNKIELGELIESAKVIENKNYNEVRWANFLYGIDYATAIYNNIDATDFDVYSGAFTLQYFIEELK